MLITGAVIISLLLTVGRGLPALKRWEEATIARATESRERLATRVVAAQSLSSLHVAAARRDRRLRDERSTLVTSATPDAAAADLGAMLQDMAEERNVNVLTVTLKPDTVVRLGLSRVAVRLAAEGDVSGLSQLLFDIETDSVPLAIRELSVSQSDPAAPSARAEDLRAELLVQTLARIVPDDSSRGQRP